MPSPTLQQLLGFVESATNEELREISQPEILLQLTSGLTPDERSQFLLAKNVKTFGGINPYVEDFLGKTLSAIASMPDGPMKDNVKQGQKGMVEKLLAYDGLTPENKSKLQQVFTGAFGAAPAAGGKRKWKMPRKMTRRYCKKTSCRKMGFTQKASCRPWKNCY